jgi:hypothetical protein
VENSLLLPPVGVWAVLSPSLADHPLRPATDRSLGRPLPHQLANRTQAPLEAPCGFSRNNEATTTCGISDSFEPLFPTSRQVTHALLSRPPLDWHHLRSTNPARLACIRHAASVYPEPGSNSPKKTHFSLTSNPRSYLYYHSSVVKVP